MHNCIFSGHCSNQLCDKSCPTLVETTYLLERNKISMNNKVFNADKNKIDEFSHVIDSADEHVCTVISKDSVSDADLITYLAICKTWKGSRLHCTAYNLKFFKYIEDIKKSWSTKSESESLEYTRIFANSAKILVVSNVDYVNFRDFECQTLLTLIQSRCQKGYITIVVTPTLSSLVGDSPFFGKLISVLKGGQSSGR